MDCVKRIIGYLSKMRHAVIRIRTEEMDFSKLPCKEFDWKYSVYGNPKEEIPSNMPTPHGKQIVTTSFVDANLYHERLGQR